MHTVTSAPYLSAHVVIPPGRPCKKEGIPFKDYKGQKGDGNCVLYALKILNGFLHQLPESSAKHLKQHRKKITELDGIWYRRATVINAIRMSFQFIGGNFDAKQLILSNQQKTLTVLLTNEKEGKIRGGTAALATEFFAKYRESSISNLLAFKEELEKRERLENHSRFLLAEKVALGEKFVKLNQEYSQIAPVDTKTLKGQYHAVHDVFVEHLSELFHMETCDWTPVSGIEALSELIQKKGPLMVGATLGGQHSVNPPQHCKELSSSDYDVYGWPEGTYKQIEGVGGHVLVLVGVQKGNVLFVDPADASKVSERRRAYSVPYAFFCKKVFTTRGQIIPPEEVRKVPYVKYIWAKRLSTN